MCFYTCILCIVIHFIYNLLEYMAFTVKGVFVYVRDLCCKITLAKTNAKKKKMEKFIILYRSMTINVLKNLWVSVLEFTDVSVDDQLQPLILNLTPDRTVDICNFLVYTSKQFKLDVGLKWNAYRFWLCCNCSWFPIANDRMTNSSVFLTLTTKSSWSW